jgi:predicted RNA binding protein YcfA (HicA-like mRNA interferase family)
MSAFTTPSPQDSLRAKIRTRIASPRQYLRKIRDDQRYAIYDILPIVTNPVLRDRMANLIAARRPRTPNFYPSLTARELCRTLERDGVVPPMPPLQPQIVADLRAYFENTPCHDPFRSHLGWFRPDSPPSPESNMGYHSVVDILRAPHVLNLFNNPLLLEVAELYLGCKPLLDNVGCWWSYGGESFGGRETSKGTQRHHRDLDSLRGFKVFFYLTDVEEDGGPHVFVKGSHRSLRLSTGRALSDAEVEAAFGTGNTVAVTGPAGSWFFEDTYGVHKGALPRRTTAFVDGAIQHQPHTPRAARPGSDRRARNIRPVRKSDLHRIPIASPRFRPCAQQDAAVRSVASPVFCQRTRAHDATPPMDRAWQP